MISHLILFPGWQLFPTLKHFKSQPWTWFTQQPSFASTSPSCRIQGLGIDISTLYQTTFLERNRRNSWQMPIKTPLRQNYFRIS